MLSLFLISSSLLSGRALDRARVCNVSRLALFRPPSAFKLVCCVLLLLLLFVGPASRVGCASRAGRLRRGERQRRFRVLTVQCWRVGSGPGRFFPWNRPGSGSVFGLDPARVGSEKTLGAETSPTGLAAGSPNTTTQKGATHHRFLSPG